jgi:hypothetical protein
VGRIRRFCKRNKKVNLFRREDLIMGYCMDCVDGYNELSWLDENDNIQTKLEKCETCNGIGWIEED